MKYLNFFDALQEAYYKHNYDKVIVKIRIPTHVADQIELPYNTTGVVGSAPAIGVEIGGNTIELILE